MSKTLSYLFVFTLALIVAWHGGRKYELDTALALIDLNRQACEDTFKRELSRFRAVEEFVLDEATSFFKVIYQITQVQLDEMRSETGPQNAVEDDTRRLSHGDGYYTRKALEGLKNDEEESNGKD